MGAIRSCATCVGLIAFLRVQQAAISPARVSTFATDGVHDMAIRFGYTLMTEQAGPRQLVRDAVSAEAAGFDLSLIHISEPTRPY